MLRRLMLLLIAAISLLPLCRDYYAAMPLYIATLPAPFVAFMLPAFRYFRQIDIFIFAAAFTLLPRHY